MELELLKEQFNKYGLQSQECNFTHSKYVIGDF